MAKLWRSAWQLACLPIPQRSEARFTARLVIERMFQEAFIVLADERLPGRPRIEAPVRGEPVEPRPKGPEMNDSYPRDLRGYGRNPPHPRWPIEARVAVQFVINYEEGGENCILHGDPASESFLSETVGAVPLPGEAAGTSPGCGGLRS